MSCLQLLGRTLLSWAISLALCGAALGKGNAPAVSEPARPWAVGVAADVQARALKLYKEGNVLFEESQHAQAVVKYREALALWDHPAIRYNLAVSLINLGQPLQAYEQLLPALRFQQAPLGPEVYKQALTYQKLLVGQLAQLKVSCDDRGAVVTLDGVRLFEGPGTQERILLPGSHQLTATKPGHLTESRPLALQAGQTHAETLKLVAISAVAMKRRWSWWKPWVVGAAGLVVAGAIGVPLLLGARSDYQQYDERFRAACPNGCQAVQLDDPSFRGAAATATPPGPPASEWANLDNRAAIKNGAAIGAFAVGGALVATSVVLLALNTSRVVEKQKPTLPSVSVTPVIGLASAGISLDLQF